MAKHIGQAIYGLTELPRWILVTDGVPTDDSYSGVAARWSGGERFPEPPKIGERVFINFNGFGAGAVVGYFVEYKWLGLYIKCDKLPKWYIEQKKGRKHFDHHPMVFGAEIKKEEAPMPKSFKPEVIADNSGYWVGNALRFATREEAEGNVRNLAWRWLMVKETRVVESEDPVTHTWSDADGLTEVKADGSKGEAWMPPTSVQL